MAIPLALSGVVRAVALTRDPADIEFARPIDSTRQGVPGGSSIRRAPDSSPNQWIQIQPGGLACGKWGQRPMSAEGGARLQIQIL